MLIVVTSISDMLLPLFLSFLTVLVLALSVLISSLITWQQNIHLTANNQDLYQRLDRLQQQHFHRFQMVNLDKTWQQINDGRHLLLFRTTLLYCSNCEQDGGCYIMWQGQCNTQRIDSIWYIPLFSCKGTMQDIRQKSYRHLTVNSLSAH